MAEVKWIKLATDVFDNRKIKQIEQMPDGDTLIVIWFKILCLAGNVNDSGLVYFSPDVPYTEQMIATEFRRPLATVQMALSIFEKFGMIEVVNDVMHVSNWEKYQNVYGMEKIREQNRIRQKNWYERQKQLPNVRPNVIITQPNATDIDKELDKELNNNIYSQVILYLNEKAGTSYRATTSKTKTLIHARTAEGFTLEDFQTVIDKKCKEWIGTEFEKFLRPETLFGSKFEGYLNAKEKSDGRKPVSQNTKENSSAGKFGFLDPD